MHKAEQISPKMAPLPGSVHAEHSRCNKPTCRCTQGQLHGPYWRRFWREGGHTRTAYVRRADVDATRQAIARWRLSHLSVRALLREFRALNAIAEEAGLW